MSKAKQEKLLVEVFETWRSPTRQSELLSRKSTRQDAWGSWHQYGLCFDVAFYDPIARSWYWETTDWDRVGQLGKAEGLRWGGDWTTFIDKPHFEYDTKGLTIEDAKEITKADGVLGVWAEIDKRELGAKPVYRARFNRVPSVGTFASFTADSLELSEQEKESDPPL